MSDIDSKHSNLSNNCIALQTSDFTIDEEYTRLRQQHPNAGAIVMFSGLVREFSNDQQTVNAIELSCYPKMTYQQIQSIGDAAMQRFEIDGFRIIHRHGVLAAHDQIVFVGVASKHRKEAFAAADMMMDFLKSQTAFWKKEITEKGEKWIEPTAADIQSLDGWVK